MSVVYLWFEEKAQTGIRLISARKATKNESGIVRMSVMTNPTSQTDDGIPGEIDFGRAGRGLHYIPAEVRVLMPVSVEKKVWEYFAGKAAQQGVELSTLLSDVLSRDIEINEALR